MLTSFQQLRMLTSIMTMSSITKKVSILQRHSQLTTTTQNQSMMILMANSSSITIIGEYSQMGPTIPDEDPLIIDHALMMNWVLVRTYLKRNSFHSTKKVTIL